MSFLPLLDDEDIVQNIEALPDLLPAFFVPRLTDKPQNPIMDTLNVLRAVHKPSATLARLPRELHIVVGDELRAKYTHEDLPEDLWNAAANKAASANRVTSWDTLRSSFSCNGLLSPFLSQQRSEVFASARYHISPPLGDPSSQIVYITAPNLLQSLRMTSTGTSSLLFLWDPLLETFRMRNIEEGKNGVLVIVGKDEVVSSSLCRRWLSTGTLLRRLETLTHMPQTRRSRKGPVSHAFTHALSTALVYLRSRVIETSGLTGDQSGDALLAASWVQYADTLEALEALASLCLRSENIPPYSYVELPAIPANLLSRIFEHLRDHLDRHSPRVVVALLAFILTMTSQDYFRHLCQSVGYETLHSHSDTATLSGSSESEPQINDEDNVDDENTTLDDDAERTFPGFFDASVTDTLSRARKSLILLRIAQPDHPLLNSNTSHPEIRWIWTSDEIESAWKDQQTGISSPAMPSHREWHAFIDADAESLPTRSYAEDMEAFAEFDLVPGAHLRDSPTASLMSSSSVPALQAFVCGFPETLSSLTPMLSHLTDLVLSPLVQHIQSLSGALVALVLSPDTHLNMSAHLTLLRSYLLLTSHPFKSRVGWALFSDADEPEVSRPGARSFATKRARSSKGDITTTRRWAVGLSSALTEGDVWPPGGADLSFHLRTVIIDSLEDSQASNSPDSGAGPHDNPCDRVIAEAEYRLGFAIRDLPSGTGREKWLNPLAIEALDFLYMDYKPPKPLDVLITPVILSKYHRLFAFNLRLLRVEHVMAALYRMTRRTTAPLFPTLTPSNKLLLHFRFVAQSFVSALSAYVFDTAIGGTFDVFLARLSAPMPGHAFPDVFALSAAHSGMLDDILSACLLRSGQKAVGDVLRVCLELVLELGILAGERARGRMEEYAAAPLLEDLWRRFGSRMMTLVKVLRALVDKGAGATRVPTDDVQLQSVTAAQVEGVTGCLHNLLVRLDTAEWWIQAGDKRSRW